MEPGRQQIRVRLASPARARLCMAGLLSGKRELAEHLAKALHRTLEQHADRPGTRFCSLKPKAAVDEHHLTPSSAIQSLTWAWEA